MTFFPLGSNLTISCSWSSRHHPSLPDADESCLHGALLYLSHLDHSATRKLKSSKLKVSKILRPFPSLDSFRIRLKSTSTSSGPNSSFQFFNRHLHTVASFQILFRSCDDCSLSRIPSSAFHFVTSLLPFIRGVRILHRCTRCHSSSRYRRRCHVCFVPHLFLRTCTTKFTLFGEREKECGSTNSQSEQQG